MLKGQIIGPLGMAAEVKQINGKEYWAMRVPHQRRKEDPTLWVTVLKFKSTDALGKYLVKGAAVWAQGDLDVTTYQRRDGGTGLDVTMWANDLQITRYADAPGAVPAGAPAPVPAAPAPALAPAHDDEADPYGDLPF